MGYDDERVAYEQQRDRDEVQVRIADALFRIAVALEKRNAQHNPSTDAVSRARVG